MQNGWWFHVQIRILVWFISLSALEEERFHPGERSPGWIKDQINDQSISAWLGPAYQLIEGCYLTSSWWSIDSLSHITGVEIAASSWSIAYGMSNACNLTKLASHRYFFLPPPFILEDSTVEIPALHGKFTKCYFIFLPSRGSHFSSPSKVKPISHSNLLR